MINRDEFGDVQGFVCKIAFGILLLYVIPINFATNFHTFTSKASLERTLKILN